MSIDVEIVQPAKTVVELVSDLLSSITVHAADAWIVMLLVPYVTPWHPGYWKAFAALIVVQNLVGAQGPTYRLWTKRRKASR